MQLTNIKNILLNKTNDSNNTYQVIAQTILDNILNIDEMSITDLALKSNASTASITRFAFSLGFNGYKALKYNIVSYNNRIHETQLLIPSDFSKGKVSSSHPVLDTSPADTNASEMFYDAYNNLKVQSMKQISIMQRSGLIASFACEIKQARKILIIAFSLAKDLSKIFAERLHRLGFEVLICSDPNYIDYELSSLTAEHFAILISLSGRNNLIVNYLKKIQIFHPKTRVAFLNCEEVTTYPKVLNVSFVSEEYLLWDNYSIASQTLLQFWDYVYYEIFKEIR